MGNIQAVKEQNKCTGCSICIAVCPKNAIFMRVSDYGFLEPYIHWEQCNSCGKCLKFCVSNNLGAIENIRDKTVFSYRAPSNHFKLLCSSGGFSLALALTYLKKDFFFVGASFSDEFKYTKHVICENYVEVFNTIGSKYIQSDMSDVLLKIVDRGNRSKYVVVGTPCQIAGFRKFIDEKGQKDRFVFVDFFCHGVPSYLLWWKYIGNLQKKIGPLIHYEFRNKFESWHEFRVRAIGEKGFYSQWHSIDPFMFFYLNNSCLRNSCFFCKYRVMSAADIRIGDFWGPQFQDDKAGVSIIVLLNERGSKVFNELVGFKEKIEVKELEANLSLQKPRFYEQFLTELKENDFDVILKKYYISMIIKENISGILKKIGMR